MLKFQQVCEVMQNMIKTAKKSKNKDKKQDSQKIVNEYESKISEIEREKV